MSGKEANSTIGGSVLDLKGLRELANPIRVISRRPPLVRAKDRSVVLARVF